MLYVFRPEIRPLISKQFADRTEKASKDEKEFVCRGVSELGYGSCGGIERLQHLRPITLQPPTLPEPTV